MQGCVCRQAHGAGSKEAAAAMCTLSDALRELGRQGLLCHLCCKLKQDPLCHLWAHQPPSENVFCSCVCCAPQIDCMLIHLTLLNPEYEVRCKLLDDIIGSFFVKGVSAEASEHFNAHVILQVQGS